MTTALATTDPKQLPARTHLGDRNQIAAIHSRLASMMQLPADVPPDVIWAAAQIAAAHHLDPFVGELYIMPVGAKKNDATGAWEQQYRAHVGIKGLRKIARERANYTAKFAVMEPDEVQRYRQDMYHPDDVGVRCTLWRLDVVRECKDLGIAYEPVVGVGFWRVKAQIKKGEWQADGIPNTWTAQQVAEKRAEINAIKLAYDLALDVADPDGVDVDATVEYVVQKIRDEDMAHALPAPRNDAVVEDDGEILFVTSDAQRNGKKQEAPTVKPQAGLADDDTITQLHRLGEEVYGDAWKNGMMRELLAEVLDKHYTAVDLLRMDEAQKVIDHLWRIIDDAEAKLAANDQPPQEELGDIWEGAPADEPVDDHPWYAAAYDGLQNGVRVFADDMLRRHRDGDHASSVKAYGYLCDLVDTVIEAATGALDGHKRVFPVLCQRDVSADDMPSSKLVGSLLTQLATHIKDANGVKAENPDYNKMTEAAVVAVYRAAEDIGTIPLFGADA